VLGATAEIIAVPGHTLDHIAYYFAAPDHDAPLLFCGDTLFACGCGRLFEGTARQMLASLDALAALPASTRVYCAHEYTLSNIRFALTVEPANAALRERAARDEATRQRGEPTVPSTIGLERETNPFLRCDVPQVRAAVAGSTADAVDRTAIFAALRERKDRFR
jgi:hydroxyacylglutathione hydrolase